LRTKAADSGAIVTIELIDAIITALRPLQFKGKGRLAELFVQRSKDRSALLFGSRFYLDTSDYLQRQMYAGSFERLETRVVRRTLRLGMTFVDVGANVGYYTALAAQLVGPTGSVFAFEPSDYAHPRLTKMVETSGLKSVRIIKCGLADVAGERFLYGAVDEEPCELHTATMVPSDNPQRALVRTETLDNVAEQLNIMHIDLMKIDVDGLEPLVLKGASNLIARGGISNILMECDENSFNALGTSAFEIIDYLKASGFLRVRRIGSAAIYASSLSQPLPTRAVSGGLRLGARASNVFS
jgi:FkbM family methyltransferase